MGLPAGWYFKAEHILARLQCEINKCKMSDQSTDPFEIISWLLNLVLLIAVMVALILSVRFVQNDDFRRAAISNTKEWYAGFGKKDPSGLYISSENGDFRYDFREGNKVMCYRPVWGGTGRFSQSHTWKRDGTKIYISYSGDNKEEFGPKPLFRIDGDDLIELLLDGSEGDRYLRKK